MGARENQPQTEAHHLMNVFLEVLTVVVVVWAVMVGGSCGNQHGENGAGGKGTVRTTPALNW